MRKMRVAVAVAAVSLVAASCGSDSKSSTSSAAATTEAAAASTEAAATTEASASTEAAATTEAAQDTVAQTAQGDLEIAVITHSDHGVFWSVFEKGANKACDDLGVTCRVLGSENDGQVQASMIDQAVADGVAGLAVSLADPDAIKGSVQAAVDAGIPVVTTNSGSKLYKEFGAFTHIGQDEFQAGQGAGEKFNEAGVTKAICGKQEQTNVGLDERCAGFEDTFEGEVITQFVALDQDIVAQQAAWKTLLDANPDVDGVFAVGPVISATAVAAAEELGRTLAVGSVDLSPDVLDNIEAGKQLFTIDQQQYLQGYVSVLALYLNATNANTLGGGLPIATGPGFVTADNAAAVKELVANGTR